MHRTRQWTLFLDESGDFDGREPVCVAGLLVPERDTPRLAAAMRRLLDQVAPQLPWPLHAAHMNRAAFHAAAFARTGRARDDEREILEQSAAALERLGGERWKNLLESMAGGRSDPSAFQQPFNLLRARDPALAGALSDVQSGARARFRQALLHFGETVEGGALLVAAADQRAAMNVPLDRYLHVLEVLFERVFAVLRGGVHEVRILCADRLVRIAEGLPRFPLTAWHVGEAVRAAERFPLQPPRPGETDPHVRLVPVEPARWGDEVHPGLVFADFVANTLRTPLSNASAWRQLGDQVHRTLALSMETVAAALPGAGPLPTAAATGEARAAVTGAFAEPEKSFRLPLGPGWARDQAGRWIVAAKSVVKGVA